MTYLEARDETFEVFHDALTSLAVGIIGYVPEVRWDGIEYPSKPDIKKYYVKTYFEEIESSQRAFTQCVSGSPSGKLFASTGMAMFSVHGPSFESNSKRKSEELGQALRKVFRLPRPNSDLWFRNAKLANPYLMDNFFRSDLYIEFYFTEVG